MTIYLLSSLLHPPKMVPDLVLVTSLSFTRVEVARQKKGISR